MSCHPGRPRNSKHDDFFRLRCHSPLKPRCDTFRPTDGTNDLFYLLLSAHQRFLFTPYFKHEVRSVHRVLQVKQSSRHKFIAQFFLFRSLPSTTSGTKSAHRVVQAKQSSRQKFANQSFSFWSLPSMYNIKVHWQPFHLRTIFKCRKFVYFLNILELCIGILSRLT